MACYLDGRVDWIGPMGPNTVSSPIGTLTYANNHVIATETIGKSPFLQALENAGLFRQNDFAQNGVSLINKIDGKSPNHAAGIEDFLKGATHAGGHSNFNDKQVEFFNDFDTAYNSVKGTAGERAWLEAQLPKVRGYVGHLQRTTRAAKQTGRQPNPET